MERSTGMKLVEGAVHRAPNSVAVRAQDGTLTYSELWQGAERLARHLRHLGVRPGDLVGQCLERSASMVVGALAAFRAGAAYVATDPAYPDQRLRWMLDDADVAAVVTDSRNAGRMLGDRVTVVLGAGGELPSNTTAEDEDEVDEPLPALPRSTDLAYVVYTSGSTGHPKGVMVEHGGLDNLIAWHHTAFAVTDADHCTQIASPGFDAAVWELWPALAAGAALHVVPEELRRDPLGLRDWLVGERITVGFMPTAVAEGLIAVPWPPDAPLRHLLTGGDALTRRAAADLGFQVVNNYGLSETAVVATSGIVTPDGSGPPSIGRPIAGVLAEVVDDELNPVAPGDAGELLIGGVAVARGYLHRDDLTAERFLENARGRWYRTGDRVAERPDGELDFLGRADDQLSLRGFRVEPAEIVAALDAHPAIDSSAVLGVGGSGGDLELIAFTVAGDPQRPDDDELSEFVSARLPDYMVPARYVWLAELPLTAHGKLDRDALRAEVATRQSPAAPADDADGSVQQAVSSIEDTIASIVAELLSVDQVGLDENFFLLGGHSMLGAQLIVRLEDLLGVEISLRYLFDHPTPAEIAEEVTRQRAQDPAGDLIAR
jgi:amino acid adenylation domain-containing protein